MLKEGYCLTTPKIKSGADNALGQELLKAAALFDQQDNPKLIRSNQERATCGLEEAAAQTVSEFNLTAFLQP